MNDLATKDWGLETDDIERAVDVMSMVANACRMIISCRRYDLRAVYDAGWGVLFGFGPWGGHTPEQRAAYYGFEL